MEEEKADEEEQVEEEGKKAADDERLKGKRKRERRLGGALHLKSAIVRTDPCAAGPSIYPAVRCKSNES